MGYVVQTGPDGRQLRFKIAGDNPSPAETARIQSIISTGQPSSDAAPQEEGPGYLSNLGSGLGRGGFRLGAGAVSLGEYVARTQSDQEAFGKSPEELAALAQSLREKAEEYPIAEGGFFAQPGFSGKAKYLANVAGESLPATIGALTTTIGGGLIGGPVGATAGAAIGTSFYVPQAFNENLEAQIQQHGRVKDWDKALAAAGASAAVESLTDRVTLGVAGMFKKPLQGLARQAVKEGVQKATTIAARRIGATGAVSAITGATEEVIQTALTRLQAEQPLADDQSKAEYLESAVVGGLLEGVFGIGVGTATSIGPAKAQARRYAAEEAAKLEGEKIKAAAKNFPVQAEAARKARIQLPNAEETPFIEGLIAGRLPQPEAIKKEQIVSPEPKAAPVNKSGAFTEQEYSKSVEMLRGEKSVSPDKIKSTLKVGRVKARAIFDEMLARKDAKTTGSKNQYLKIISSGTQADISREYVVRPIEDSARTPYIVKTKGRVVGEPFKSETAAREWAERAGIEKFQIEQNTTDQQYGVYEVQNVKNEAGGREVIGTHMLDRYGTLDEANAAARDLDATYSPESAAVRKKVAERDQMLAMRDTLREELGPYRDTMQTIADRIVGENRVGVELATTVDPLYLRMSGVQESRIPKDNVIVEGVTLPKTDETLRQIVAVSNDIIDPSLSPEKRQQKLNGVLTHELVHVLRNADLLTPSEWKSLVRYADTAKVPGERFTWIEKQTARHVPGQPFLAEEAIAEMLRGHMENPTLLQKPVRGIMQKIADFLKRLFNFAQGKTGDEVIRSILGGEVAARPEGYGGMGPRPYEGDPLFSTVKVDPFYSQTERFFQDSKQEKAQGKQWLGMLKNSGVKKDELVWLDLENWMEAWGDRPITKGEILDYIRASSLDIKEDWSTTKATATPEEEEIFNDLDTQLQQLYEQLEPAVKEDADWSYYVQQAEETGGDAFQLAIFGRADSDPTAREFVDTLNKWLPYRDKVMPKQPAWEAYLQPGYKNYTTAAFYLPQTALKPEWEGNAHYDIPNVIAFTRFTERRMEGKKVLFIEELQSDLHQTAARTGYSSDYSRRRENALDREASELLSEIQAIEQEMEEIIGDRDYIGPDNSEEGERVAYGMLDDRLQALRASHKAIESASLAFMERNRVPDAPLKSSWEDFVIKRLLRYAAENDFDSIMWHGDADSVAETEHYYGFNSEYVDDRTLPLVRRLGDARKVRMAYERALEEGDQQATEELSTLIVTLETNQDVLDAYDAQPLSPEVLDKYFPALERGGVRYYNSANQDFNITAIVNRYLQRLPRIAKQIGKKFGAVPYLYNPNVDAGAELFEGAFEEYFMSPDDVFSFIANYDVDPDLEGRMRVAAQVMRNQRTVNIEEAFEKANILLTEIEEVIASDGGPVAAEEGPAPYTPRLDEDGNPIHSRWMMDMTESLKETALYKGFPLFSAIDPDAKSYQGFEQGKNIRIDAIDFGDPNTTIPGAGEPVFSAVDPDRKYEAMVQREIRRTGYTPYARQKLAKARVYDRNVTPYGMPLEDSEPAYASKYITRDTATGKTPVFGAIENPSNGKREPAVIHLGADWKGTQRGVAWPIGYGFNHAAWHFGQISKDTNTPSSKQEVLKTIIKSIAKGGELKMDRGNMGVLTYKGEGWRKPLKIVVQRTIMPEADAYFKKGQPVWKFITAYTDDAANDVFYSAVNIDPLPQYSASAPFGNRVPIVPSDVRLDELEAQITYNNLAPTLQRLSKLLPTSMKYKYEKGVESTLIAAQDRMLPVGDLIDRMRKNDGLISNDNDTYLRETLFSGQTDEQLHDARRLYYDPMIKSVQSLPVTDANVREAKSLNDTARTIMENYTNPKMAVAELYLYARHAQERNREMRKRNADLKDVRPEEYEAGSGMTNEEAQTILEWVESLPYSDKLSSTGDPTSVRSRFRQIISHTNDVRVEAGLNPEFRGVFNKDGSPVDPYSDYAPLRNWVQEHLDSDKEVEEFAKQGKGFRVIGKEDRSALGRKSLGSDLIGHAVLQNEEAIVRANKNKVSRSFLDLVRDNPETMKDVAEIVSAGRRRFIYDRSTGKVKSAPDPSYRTDPSVLGIKEGGREVFVKIKDPRIARALNHRSTIGNGPLGGILKLMLGLNRILANTRTAWNPEFMINNMLKDLTAAITNISEVEMKGLRRDILKSLPSALMGIREGEAHDTATTEWGNVYKDFKEHGGKTAFYGIRELEDTIKKINGELSADVSGTNTQKVLKPLRELANFVERYNVIVENGIRVATYRNLRDRLLASTDDPANPVNIRRASERAAFTAKNLTVNFNMGGEIKPLMNAMYLFYNAGIQGSMALINPLSRSKRVRKIWGSILAAGLMQDILMAMISPEDEDGVNQYDKLDDYILENNLILMDPFGLSERGYFKVPLPYVLNGIYNAGRTISATARGKNTIGEGINSIVGTMLDSLNPLSGSNSFLNFVAPTVVDPFVDIAQNENFAGAPISPPASPFGVPEKASQRYWNNTSPAYVTIADWASKLSGSKGDYIPGALEYSPNEVEYVFEWLGGGAWTFLRRSWDFASPVGSQKVFLEAMSGGEWSANDVPILRRFYGNITSRNDLQYYIKNRDRVLAIRAELRNASKDGNAQHYLDIMNHYPSEYKLIGAINSLETARRKISQQIKKIQESKSIPEAQKKDMIRLLKERQDELVGRANTLFRES